MIPTEHQLICNSCGTLLDMRELGQVLQHGWIDDDGKEICYLEPFPVEVGSVVKKGEPIQWVPDKSPIHLN